VPFEQDLVLPAMLFAPAGGILLARVLPLGGGRRRWLGATAAALVFAALVGFAGVEARYHLRYAATTIRVYEGVLAPFIGAPGPDEPARQLDGKALMDFLRGEYDRVHYYPTRSLAQNLKLADFVARAVPPGGVVFTDAGLAIVRPEAHHVIKASVLYYLALLEQKDTGEANCRSVRRFMPGACDPGQPPGQRLLAVLLASNPELIVFGYGVIDVIDKFPETRGWYLGGYTTWYDPAVNAFVGLRTGHGWPAKPN
jgi:hypothetical protein